MLRLRLRRLRRWRRLRPDLLPEPSRAVLLAGATWVKLAIPFTSPVRSLRPVCSTMAPLIRGTLGGREKGLMRQRNPARPDRGCAAFCELLSEGVLRSSHSPGPIVHGLRTVPEPHRLTRVRIPYVRDVDDRAVPYIGDSETLM